MSVSVRTIFFSSGRNCGLIPVKSLWRPADRAFVAVLSVCHSPREDARRTKQVVVLAFFAIFDDQVTENIAQNMHVSG